MWQLEHDGRAWQLVRPGKQWARLATAVLVLLYGLAIIAALVGAEGPNAVAEFLVPAALATVALLAPALAIYNTAGKYSCRSIAAVVATRAALSGGTLATVLDDRGGRAEILAADAEVTALVKSLQPAPHN